MTREELEEFRGLLLDKRRAILGDLDGMAAGARRAPAGEGETVLPDPAGAAAGTDENEDRDVTLGLLANERMLLREIADALGRIDRGTYGICLATGSPISTERLRARPWARHCIQYARRLEERRTRGRGPSRGALSEDGALPYDEGPMAEQDDAGNGGDARRGGAAQGW